MADPRKRTATAAALEEPASKVARSYTRSYSLASSSTNVQVPLCDAPPAVPAPAKSGSGGGGGEEGGGAQRWSALPQLIWLKVAKQLHANDMLAFAMVSRQFRDVQRQAGRGAPRTDLRVYRSREVEGVYQRLAYGPNEILQAHKQHVYTRGWLKWAYDELSREAVGGGSGSDRGGGGGGGRHQVMNLAAFYGYVDVVAWLRARGCEYNAWTCSSAAEGGHIATMEWMVRDGCRMDHWAAACAARGGHLPVLKWMREREAAAAGEAGHGNHGGHRVGSFGWSSIQCTFAASGGHVDVLEWLVTEAGCPLIERTAAEAAKENRLDVLGWLESRRCPWDASVTAAAAAEGHLAALKFLRKKGCPWDASCCGRAAAGGHLEVLKWARENGCEWDEATTRNAATFGQLEALKWARKRKGACPWDEEDVVSCAAAGGHVCILRWAIEEEGCACTDSTLCWKAARAGQLEALQYLRERHGCPWDQLTTRFAAMKGHVACFEWAVSQGCAFDERALEYASDLKHWGILEAARAELHRGGRGVAEWFRTRRHWLRMQGLAQ